MGTDTPISPDSEAAPEIAPRDETETGAAAPAVDSTPETAPAMAEEAAAADFPLEETAPDELPPIEDERMTPPARKSSKMIILLAAVFVLAIAVFAVVFFVFGSSEPSNETANIPPPIKPRTPPTTTTTTTTPTPVTTTIPPAATTTPTIPPAAATTMPTTPPAPTLPIPAAPAYATPIQSTSSVADIFAGGPPPPKIAKMRLKNIRMPALIEALGAAEVDVSVNHGIGEDEVLFIGEQKDINRAKNILARLDVEPPPVIVASALPFPIPTSTPGDVPPPVMTAIPLAPPVGRHAGWIYNNVNGQIFAIFENQRGMAYQVKVGSEVDGMKVISISPDILVLRDMRDPREPEYRLKMQGADSFQTGTGRSVTATPAAGAPAMPPWR